MDVLLRYFWFWCGAFWMVLVATTIRRRLSESARHGQVSGQEAAAFVRGLAISIGSFCLVLGLIALTAHHPAPTCVQPFSFADRPSAASNIVTFMGWVAVLGWIWMGSGAHLLARVTPALINPPNYRRTYSPSVVRIVVTLLLAVAAVGSVAGSRSVPRDPSCEGVALPNRPLQPTSGARSKS
jgi:hypothetical protein